MREFWIAGVATMVGLLAVPWSASATNANGANTLSACTLAQGRAGGVEVYNKNGSGEEGGGSRVMCVNMGATLGDSDMDAFPTGQPDSYLYNIGSFDDKTQSLRVRSNPGCYVRVTLLQHTGFGGWNTTKGVDNLAGSSPDTDPFELSREHDNIVSSIALEDVGC